MDTTGGRGAAVIAPRGAPFAISGRTGTVAAALAQDALVFAMRAAPASSTAKVFVEHVRIRFTTIVAFTTPVTVDRVLGLYRGSAAAPTGGTLLVPVAKATGDQAEVAAAVLTPRIATTAGLTAGAFVREANAIDTMTLVHAGAAGAYAEAVFEAHSAWTAPLMFQPGELLVVSNPVAFDAAGTWQAAITVQGYVGAGY